VAVVVTNLLKGNRAVELQLKGSLTSVKSNHLRFFSSKRRHYWQRNLRHAKLSEITTTTSFYRPDALPINPNNSVKAPKANFNIFINTSLYCINQLVCKPTSWRYTESTC